MPAKDRGQRMETSQKQEQSAWQLRFGRKAVTNQPRDCEPRSHAPVCSRTGASPPQATASIAEQLLQSLAERERVVRLDHEVTRACAEQLLGKRNAFASDLRMDDKVSAELAQQPDSDDLSAVAKEIIRSRMTVENQAEALRRGGTDRSQKKGRTEPTNRQAVTAAERLRQLRDIQARREREHNAEASRMSRGRQPKALPSDRGRSVEAPEASKTTNDEPNNEIHPENIPARTSRPRPILSQRVRTTTPRSVPPQPDPIAQMEQRQAKIREMRETRRLQPKRTTSSRGSSSSPTVNQSEESGQPTVTSEEKKLQERIMRLNTENQHAAELAERVHARKRQWEIKSAAFGTWKRLLLGQHDCVAHALAVLHWKTMRRCMTRWRNYSVDCRRERIASESRERCVREQSLLVRADAFLRKKQLPRWFYRWAASVAAAKERRKVEEAAQTRRQQAQRLLERLVRGPDAEPPTSDGLVDGQSYQSPSAEREQRVVVSRKSTGAAAASSRASTRLIPTASRDRSAAVSTASRSRQPYRAVQARDVSQSSPSSAPPPPPTSARPTVHAELPRAAGSSPVDPIYTSMLERAGERKERREVLRLKYARVQQEKRETLAMQIEDRAAALLRLKEAERQRVREKKRQAVVAAKAKQERLEQAADLLYKAQAFDRQRLLRYYAFRPWKFEYECRQRVARYVQSWHAMRVTHDCWLKWQSLIAERRRERRALEQERLASASHYYDASIRRRAAEREREAEKLQLWSKVRGWLGEDVA